MKVGVFAPQLAVRKGREDNVSGHVQIPLEAANRLHHAGHEVHVIGTRLDESCVLPNCAAAHIPVHWIKDGRRRGQLHKQERRQGYNVVRLVQQLQEMKWTVERLKLEVLHLFGYSRVARLAGVLASSGLAIPTVVTLLGPLSGRAWLPFYRRVDAFLTATEFVARQTQAYGVPVRHVRHGPIRVFPRHTHSDRYGACRVLFWREASREGGADLCIAAFNRVAPRYPHFNFDFAIRYNRNEVGGLDVLRRDHANVAVWRFPYTGGLTLEQLIAESLCIVLPFRRLSIHPQLAILESMASGTAVISSDIGSNLELILDGITGRLVPTNDVAALETALDECLSDPSATVQMGKRAAAASASRWNWSTYADEVGNVYEAVRTGRPMGSSR